MGKVDMAVSSRHEVSFPPLYIGRPPFALLFPVLHSSGKSESYLTILCTKEDVAEELISTMEGKGGNLCEEKGTFRDTYLLKYYLLYTSWLLEE